MKFTNTDYTGGSIEMTVPEDATLPEVLYYFTRFLRASGFTIPYDEHLDFVDE